MPKKVRSTPESLSNDEQEVVKRIETFTMLGRTLIKAGRYVSTNELVAVLKGCVMYGSGPSRPTEMINASPLSLEARLASTLAPREIKLLKC